jgi:competence protein ComEC
LPDRTLVALSFSLEALAEDCSKATLVVTARGGLADCTALLIDRDELRASGALAINRVGRSFEILRANPQGQDRPWARRIVPAVRPVLAPAHQPTTRDATPRAEEIEPTNPDQ